jgi:hypothetical protein
MVEPAGSTSTFENVETVSEIKSSIYFFFLLIRVDGIKKRSSEENLIKRSN